MEGAPILKGSIFMKMEKSCGAIVARQTDTGREILLIRHVNGGHWAFPKGHVEENETEEQTALREILEETGLSVTLGTGFRTVVTYSPKPGVMKDVVYFAAETNGGTTQMQIEEVSDMRWVNLNDTDTFITYENDRNIIAQYRSYIETK